MDDADGGLASRISPPALLMDPQLLSVLLIAFVGPFSTGAIAPALPGMASSLGVADARIGLVVTAITLPPMLLAPMVGALGDIYGRRKIAIPALFFFGAGGMAIPFVDEFWMILVLRGIQGLGMAGTAPVAITLLGDLYSGPTATTAQGLRASGTALAGTLTAFVGGWLAGFGWSFPFFLYTFAFVVMVIVYRYVPETAQGRDVNRRFWDILRESARLFRSVLTDLELLVIISGGFMRFFALFAIVTFIPLFAVRVLGATAFEVGVILGLRGIRIVVAPTAGLWIARFSRKWAFLGAVSIVSGTIALFPFAPNVLWLGVLMVLNAIGDAIFSPLLNDTVTARVSDASRNSVVSVLRSFKETGKTAAPVVLGIVLTIGGFGWVFMVTAGVLVLYIVAVLVETNGGDIIAADTGTGQEG